MRRFSLMCALLLSAVLYAQDLQVKQLLTEYHQQPLGVDETAPRLSWQLLSNTRDVKQTAYQIQVAATADALTKGKNLLWDSGWKESNQNTFIKYEGPAAASRQRYLWRVRVKDNQNRTSGWSETAWWEMGLLQASDWQAQWISADVAENLKESQPAHLLRRNFALKGTVQKARFYISSLGLYEAHINGQRVGDQVLTPGWTAYQSRLQYQTYDVTAMLKNGDNAIGVMLGDGWYRGFIGFSGQRNFYGEKLGLRCQLEVTYTNGKTETINSDPSWKSSNEGPVRWSDIYNGECYDARLEKAGWTNTGFNDTGWRGVQILPKPNAALIAPAGPPVKAITTIPSKKVFQTPRGETVIDFGQNMVGWIRMNVKGQPGDTVVIHHAEVLDKAGNFYTDNLRAAKQEIVYVLKGNPQGETYEPHFTFQGFRYIRVKGWKGMPATGDFTGIVVHSDMPLTGQFACSDSLLNQLQHNIQWGQRGNFVDVPTDCPQRDERLGWTGDAQAFSRTAAYNFQVGGFFTKWLADVAADQDTAGNVPYVIPNVLGPNAKGSTGWADAATIVPWAVYQTYGDKRILEKQYPSMKAWVEYMRNKAGKNLLWNTGFHFGDWLFYRPNDDNDGRSAVTDKYIIAQSFFIHSTDLLQKAAEILGYQEDAAAYGNLAKQLREAYMREYVTPNGRLLSSTQTAYVLALQFDILPESLRQQTAGRLAENIQRYQNHLTTGFLGTPYITHVLTRFGYNNLAYTLLQQQDYPSWLYPVKMGATTIWERWDGIKPDGSFQTEGMNSFNHYAYGAIGEWMYRNVAGLQIDPSHPGYEHLILSPLPGGTLTSAISHLETIKGQAGSGWYLEQNNIRIVAEVPANTTATVRLPYAPDGLVRESGKALETGNGIHSMQQNGQSLVLELGSGKYEFSYPTTLFPDRNYKFTLASPLVDMLGNAKAKGLLDKHFPGLSEHPQLDRFKQMTLSQVLDQYIWTADNLSDFEAELKQIK